MIIIDYILFGVVGTNYQGILVFAIVGKQIIAVEVADVNEYEKSYFLRIVIGNFLIVQVHPTSLLIYSQIHEPREDIELILPTTLIFC